MPDAGGGDTMTNTLPYQLLPALLDRLIDQHEQITWPSRRVTGRES